MGNICCPREGQIDNGEANYSSQRNDFINYSQLSLSNSLSGSEQFFASHSFVSSIMRRRRQRDQYRNNQQISLHDSSIQSLQIPNEDYRNQRQNMNEIDMLFQIYIQIRGGYPQIQPNDIVGFVRFLQMLQNQPTQTGLSAQQIQSLPRIIANNNDFTCAVCIDTIKNGQQILNFMCKHPFHVTCISEWLQRSNRCPSCRRQIQIQARN